MRIKLFALLILICLCTSVVSAEIIFEKDLNEIYNLGETISVPVKIKSLTNTYGIFQINLLCNGDEINFYKNGISLIAGEEKSIEAILPLIKEVIEDSKGMCKIKAILLSDYILTEDFKISDFIEVKASINKKEFNPEEEVSITGNATKESGNKMEGFAEIAFYLDGKVEIKKTETVSYGKFQSKIKIPRVTKAGEYTVIVTVYERDSEGRITNKGSYESKIIISQIPTNLEIFFEQKELLPGEILRAKAILRDQTGEKIDSTTVISIKNENNNILEQIEKKTDEFLEYTIKEKEAPGNWKVIAISNHIINEASFKIKEQEKIDMEIIEKTVILTNTGNVFYNKTVFVKIGEEPFNIDATLKVGETKKYNLMAPSGEYQIRVLSSEGKEIEKKVMLTGDAISIKEISEGTMEFVRRPAIWIFILIVFGFVAFFIFGDKKKESFFKKFTSKKEGFSQDKEKISTDKKLLVLPARKASLSLSIKGEQQKSSVTCIKIKNHSEIVMGKGNARETLQKITRIAEDAKAHIYENNECIFFIFAPISTKTFENEMSAIILGQNAKKIIDDHNRLFSQKIDYGISIENGDLVVKKTGEQLEFAGLGTLIMNSRKLASLSQGEIFVGEKMSLKIHSNAKLEKHSSDKGIYYTIKEIKDKEKYKKFLSSFVKRLEKDNPNTKKTDEEN